MKAVVRSALQITASDFTGCGLDAPGCDLLVCDGIERAICEKASCNDDVSVAVKCNPEIVRRALTSDKEDTKSVIASASTGPGRRLQGDITYAYDFSISFSVVCTEADCSDTAAQEASATTTLAGLDSSLTSLTSADVSAGITAAKAALSDAEQANLVGGFTVNVVLDDIGQPVVTIIADPGVQNFEPLGKGNCVDLDGNTFTYFSFKGVPNGTVQGCATACLTSPCFTAYPDWNLRGLTWEFSTNSDGSFDTWCYCSIDGYVADQNCTRVNAYGTKEGTLFKRDGTGPNIFSDGQGSDRCFAYRP